ncbi:hypothetical protein GC098_25060 [Paenibacillus sp. LMG 31458]|uniref:Uncharacterized protein n=1 Tax=Paenibacillus phytorum TaxID=2654977 RepID=A0ABX1Y1Z0_9BACL|nr:hypothetical protein [Paenibacillus phytorum]NOU74624.1 hypothetical protein [Paenibacillus phytorum]
MKKKLTIAALILAVSAVGGSAYAASDTTIGGTIKSSIASVSATLSPTSSSKTISADEAAKLGDSTSFEKMAKEKGITLEELFAQLEKEGKITKTVSSTEPGKATGTSESTMASQLTASTQSSEAVSLEKMAKEQGVTVDELRAKIKEEGKHMEVGKLTDSSQAVKSNK